jgi:hypothetical protein
MNNPKQTNPRWAIDLASLTNSSKLSPLRLWKIKPKYLSLAIFSSLLKYEV